MLPRVRLSDCTVISFYSHGQAQRGIYLITSRARVFSESASLTALTLLAGKTTHAFIQKGNQYGYASTALHHARKTT